MQQELPPIVRPRAHCRIADAARKGLGPPDNGLPHHAPAAWGVAAYTDRLRPCRPLHLGNAAQADQTLGRVPAAASLMRVLPEVNI